MHKQKKTNIFSMVKINRRKKTEKEFPDLKDWLGVFQGQQNNPEKVVGKLCKSVNEKPKI